MKLQEVIRKNCYQEQLNENASNEDKIKISVNAFSNQMVVNINIDQLNYELDDLNQLSKEYMEKIKDEIPNDKQKEALIEIEDKLRFSNEKIDTSQLEKVVIGLINSWIMAKLKSMSPDKNELEEILKKYKED